MYHELHRISDNTTIRYDPLLGTVNVPCSINGKYLAFKFINKHIKVHRFAWYYMKGEWPKEQIDHKDENKLNNKWDNLQELSGTNNQLKSSTIRRSNTSGYVGVSFQKSNKNWIWCLQINYKPKRKCGFRCPTSAALARDKFILENNIPYAYLNLLERA